MSDRDGRGEWLLRLSNLLLVEQQNGLVITAEDFARAIRKRGETLEDERETERMESLNEKLSEERTK